MNIQMLIDVEEWLYDSLPTPNVLLSKDHQVLMMTIKILKLHMNNDPSSGVPHYKPDFEDSLSSWTVVSSKVHSLDQPQGYKGKCRLRIWKWNVK